MWVIPDEAWSIAAKTEEPDTIPPIIIIIISCHGPVVECRTRDPEVPSSNPIEGEKKISQVQSEQYHHQSLCTRVKYLKLSEVPSLCLRSKIEIPLRAKPTHYMNIYDDTNRTKRSHATSTKVHASWSEPMPASGKSTSGTSGTCHHSRTGTAMRVAGTEDHLPRPDSENASQPPKLVNRPCDQPELKKWRQWSHNENKEVMYCYYMAIKDKPRGYQKRMHQQWKDRGNIEYTEQQLCDQKKQIEDRTLLTPAEIEEVKQQVKTDTFQEEDDQQSAEEQ